MWTKERLAGHPRHRAVLNNSSFIFFRQGARGYDLLYFKPNYHEGRKVAPTRHWTFKRTTERPQAHNWNSLYSQVLLGGKVRNRQIWWGKKTLPLGQLLDLILSKCWLVIFQADFATFYKLCNNMQTEWTEIENQSQTPQKERKNIRIRHFGTTCEREFWYTADPHRLISAFWLKCVQTVGMEKIHCRALINHKWNHSRLLQPFAWTRNPNIWFRE